MTTEGAAGAHTASPEHPESTVAEAMLRFQAGQPEALLAALTLAGGLLAGAGWFGSAGAVFASREIMQATPAPDLVLMHAEIDRLRTELEHERGLHLERIRQDNVPRSHDTGAPRPCPDCPPEWADYLDRETGVGAPMFDSHGQQVSGAPYVTDVHLNLLKQIGDFGALPNRVRWLVVPESTRRDDLNQWGLIDGYRGGGSTGPGWRLTMRGVAVLDPEGNPLTTRWEIRKQPEGYNAIRNLLMAEDDLVAYLTGNSLTSVRIKVMKWFKEQRLNCLCISNPDAGVENALIETWM